MAGMRNFVMNSAFRRLKTAPVIIAAGKSPQRLSPFLPSAAMVRHTTEIKEPVDTSMLPVRMIRFMPMAAISM